jgi:hypothetical protein
VEVHILAFQARALLWVGIGWLLVGLALGTDPATLAWRAALAALAAMWASGLLLRTIAGVINERLSADLVARDEAAKAASAAPAPQPARSARPATPRPAR